jgi:glycosyltransferase involved in cell wall biosynthesis
MPLGYDHTRFSVEGPARRSADRFTFLSVFEWGERKAPDVLLRAFSAAFSGREDVLLLLRVANHDGDLDVSEEIENLRLPEGGPKVALLYNQHIAHDTLGTLYRSADAFVLPTRGEGWGMPILEAMACGLPTIATAWSGQTEFFGEAVGYPVPPKALVPADAKCPYYEGFRWAEPDFDALVAAMRRVVENREEARLRGEAAALEAARRWTWGHAADRVVARLAEIPGP